MMSSPLSMLKKGSARFVPFRVQPDYHLTVPTFPDTNMIDAADQKLLADVLELNEKKKETPLSDFALMQSMISKIQLLEKQVESQTKEIIEKDRIIHKYEEQLTILQEANKSSANLDKSSELQAQCFILRKQVEQMEEFLADYGLIWVGDPEEEEDTESMANVAHTAHSTKPSDVPSSSRPTGYWSQDASVPSEKISPNFDVLLKNIRELNILAGEGQSKVLKDADKKEARLKLTEAIPLALYSNGLLLFDGPFRPYSDKETRQFLVDILDGYFPSELQARYPEGVPFKVLDRREAFYKDKFTEIFGGEGRRLKSADSSTRDIETVTSDEHKLQTGKTLTDDQFLGRLPRSIVKSGKIINIRDEIGNFIHSSNPHSSNQEDRLHETIQVLETELVRELRERINSSSTSSAIRGRPGTPRSGGLLVTLRIRSEDGACTYVLKLRPSETIGAVRTYINTHRKHLKIPEDYSIVQTFPKHMIFDDVKTTLEQYGLMSNAALFLRKHN